jgi:D-alanine-D-alanine ligase
MASIGVVFGGPSPEHDISILTGLQSARALADEGLDVVCVYWTRAGAWLRVPPTLEAGAFLEPTIAGAEPVDLTVPGGFSDRRRRRSTPLDVDVILNCCHGGPGEDGTLTGLLLLAGYHVTGPAPEVCALTMDKLATAATARAAGVPTIDTCALTRDLAEPPFPRPWLVKPRFGGSSIGVHADIADLDTARALSRIDANEAGAILQPYHEGWADLNVAVRTSPALQLSAIERPVRGRDPVYSYEAKYLAGSDGMESAARELPAAIPDPIAERIRGDAARLATVFGLTGAARVDFLWDGADTVVLCEINAIPGAWGAYLWREVGVSRATLLRDLVTEARAAPVRRPQWTTSSDGAALRVAGSIGAKLA